jgi:hypothetical protein
VVLRDGPTLSHRWRSGHIDDFSRAQVLEQLRQPRDIDVVRRAKSQDRYTRADLRVLFSDPLATVAADSCKVRVTVVQQFVHLKNARSSVPRSLGSSMRVSRIGALQSGHLSVSASIDNVIGLASLTALMLHLS